MEADNQLIIPGQTKFDKHPKGLISICSSHPVVLKTCINASKENKIPLIIESTCNQVNQYGGYTGFSPQEFVTYCRTLANKIGFPLDLLIIGGDHLGPSVWSDQPSRIAMDNAKRLVELYAKAGYSKFHLDASMPCNDDKKPLPEEVISNREAELCAVIEELFTEKRIGDPQPCYVMGSEVPTPGGALPNEKSINVSTVKDTKRNIELTKKIFKNNGLLEAWNRTIAFVVEPGVEFGDNYVFEYNRSKARKLSEFIESYENLVFEAHSTDFQNKKSLREMVIDHFSILKVGPALTFAYREAIFGLAYIESELAKINKFEESNFLHEFDSAMLQNPSYWQNHYFGNTSEIKFKMKFGYSDRVRYYWTSKVLSNALQKLLQNLSSYKIPLSLVSQFMPDQFTKIKNGVFEMSINNLIQGKILDVYNDYLFASGLV